MSELDIISDFQGNEYLAIDTSDLYDDSLMGDKLEDFETLLNLGGGYDYKVRSKINNKIYTMKRLDLKKIKQKNNKVFEFIGFKTKYLETLSHPHIIKYYKNFTIDDTLYIITDYASDGNMEDYIEAHKEMKISIPENDIWNFILQCMWSLYYIHSKGLIHGDIKLSNIYLDNNMKIKLGNFGFYGISFDKSNKYSEESYLFSDDEDNNSGGTKNLKDLENNEALQNDQKNDVYNMGVCFYEMCYFCHPKMKNTYNNKEKYTDELNNIINCMLEKDKKKRENSEEIFRKIMDKYYKRYNRNSSIDSIFKCLNAYNNLYDEIFKMDDKMLKNKDFTKIYIYCLKSLRKEKNLSYFLYYIDRFRNMLVSSNLKIEGSEELDPKYIIAFLFEKLNKELNYEIPEIKDILSEQNKGKKMDKEINKYYYKGPHLINTEEDVNGINEVEVRLKFVNEILSKLNSPISNNFKALIRITNTCDKCHNVTYNFNCYLLASLDIEKISYNKNTSLKLEECLAKPISTEKEIYCGKCLNKTKQKSEKVLFSFPKLLVIYIERGVNFECNKKISVKEEIKLYDSEIETERKYQLVALIKRNNNTRSFYSISKFHKKLFLSEQSKITKVKSFDDNIKGDVVMFFYEEIEKIEPDKKNEKNGKN